VSGSELLINYEDKDPVNDICTPLYFTVLNVMGEGRLEAQPILWENPSIPEPVYFANGTLVGEAVLNSSLVVASRFGTITNLFLVVTEQTGTFMYLLIRTDFFGSLKLFKYQFTNPLTEPLELVWKKVIIPHVDGQMGALPPTVGMLHSDPTTKDIFVLCTVTEDEVPTVQNYLNVGNNKWTNPASGGTLLLRIDPLTGNFVGWKVIDLDLVSNNILQGSSVSSSVVPGDGFVYLSVHGRYVQNSIVTGEMLLRYSAELQPNSSEAASSTLFSVFPAQLQAACNPATASVWIMTSIFLQKPSQQPQIVFAGNAGFRQELTGSITAGGKAFLAFANPATVYNSSLKTPLRVQFFGETGRENAIDHLALDANGNLLASIVYDRGLTHDPPDRQGQHAGLLQTVNAAERSCNTNSDWWLTCEQAQCLEWCYLLPVTQNNEPSIVCSSPGGGDGLSGGAIAGIVIACLFAVFVVVLGIAGFAYWWYRVRSLDYTIIQ
jgi:hypothetical protein